MKAITSDFMMCYRRNQRRKFEISCLLLCTVLVAVSCTQSQAIPNWKDLVRSGRIEMQKGAYSDAKRFLSQGLKEATDKRVDGVLLAPIYLDLSEVNQELSDAEGARTAVDAAIASAKSGGDNSEQLIPLYKQSAKLFYRKKDFSNSQIAAQEALRLERECCDPKSEKLLDGLNLCISAACAQDRCADTGPLLLEQLEIRREHFGPNHPHVAVSLCLLGELAEKKGRWKEAERRYEEALAIRRKTEPALVTQTEKNLTRVRAHLERKSG